MNKIPNNDVVPTWISEYVPRELAESTLFRFEVELQAVQSYKCPKCEVEEASPGKCNDCNKQLRPLYKTITVDLLPDLDLDYEALEEQMQYIPAQYAFWAAMYSEMRCKVAKEERNLKAIKGLLVERIQQRARDDKIKLTGEQVKYVLEADASLIKQDKELQKAQMQCGKLYHMLEALKMKADMCRSLAGFKKQENM